MGHAQLRTSRKNVHGKTPVANTRLPQNASFQIGRVDHSPDPWTTEAKLLIKKLDQTHPETKTIIDREREAGRGYYQKTCFKLYVDNVDLGDGGYTDWTAAISSNRKECCFISGVGLERLAVRLLTEPRKLNPRD